MCFQHKGLLALNLIFCMLQNCWTVIHALSLLNPKNAQTIWNVTILLPVFLDYQYATCEYYSCMYLR